MNKRRLSFPFTFVLPLFSLLVLGSIYFLSESKQFYFDIPLRTSQSGILRLSVDFGHGLQAGPWSAVSLVAGESRIAHFRLPSGNLKQIHLQLPGGGATVLILGDAVIGLRGGSLGGIDRRYLTIPSTGFQPWEQIYRVVDIGRQRHFSTASGQKPPTCIVRDFGPILLQPDYGYLVPRLLGLIGLFLVGSLAASRFQTRYTKISQALGLRIRSWTGSHATGAILLAAAAGVLISCYPVIFLGKSFVSPDMGTILLYDRYPTVPRLGSTTQQDLEEPIISDVGAMAWQNQPYSVVQSRALLTDGQLPLWNRYNWCGVPLLGQGQSMFGDPLHFLVILAKGSAVAWDIKFLLARLLFASTIGLIVYECTKHGPTSLLLSFASCFIGFFNFRFNHPANFGFCYAPLILLSWIKLTNAPGTRRAIPWLLGFFAANWMVINSGTVKEAYMLCLTLNFSGFLTLALGKESVRAKGVKLLHLGIVGVALVLATAPVWWTFLDTLGKSFTLSAAPGAAQIQSKFVLGLFDDIFFREINANDGFLLPSANFLILLGSLLTAGYCYFLRSNRIVLALFLGLLVPFCMVFGFISASTISRLPFIRQVGGIHVVFSTPIVIQLCILAGFGIAYLAGHPSFRNWLIGFSSIVAGMAWLLYLYFFGTNGRAPVLSRMFLCLSALVVGATFLLPVAVLLSRYLRAAAPMFHQIAVFLIAILLWRHGLHVASGSPQLDKFIFSPQARANLMPTSPALESVKSVPGDAARMVGFENNVFAGYNDVQGIESLSGPDALQPRLTREMTIASGLEYIWVWRIRLTQQNLRQSKPVCDLLNVKYYFALPGSLPDEIGGLRRLRSLDLDIYESNTVWPRAFFTDQVIAYNSTADFVKLIGTRDGRPFAAIDKADMGTRPELADSAKPNRATSLVVAATNYALTANGTSFDLIAPARGVAVLSETYLPNDFRVYVNGISSSYFRVNHAFKGIWLDHPGIYHVSFTYWPEHFTQALLCFGIGVGLLLIWIVMARILTRPKLDEHRLTV